MYLYLYLQPTQLTVFCFGHDPLRCQGAEHCNLHLSQCRSLPVDRNETIRNVSSKTVHNICGTTSSLHSVRGSVDITNVSLTNVDESIHDFYLSHLL